jgi:hypothetical protein
MLKNSTPVFFKRPTEDRQEISCGRIYTPLDISRFPDHSVRNVIFSA